MDTASLIFKILEKKGMEQKEFARQINVSEKIVSTWSTGRSKSYAKHLPKIAKVLDTTVDYLLTGKESQEAPPTAELQLDSALAAELASLTPDEVPLVRVFVQGLKAGRKAPTSPDK